LKRDKSAKNINMAELGMMIYLQTVEKVTTTFISMVALEMTS